VQVGPETPSCAQCEQPSPVAELWRNPGRWWGVRNRGKLAIAPQVWGLTREGFYKLRRISRSVCKARGYKLRPMQSYSTFMSDAGSMRALAFVGAWRV
jgi:hypothetical protein